MQYGRSPRQLGAWAVLVTALIGIAMPLVTNAVQLGVPPVGPV